MAITELCDSAGLRWKRKSLKLVDHGRVLWAALFCHTPGLAAFAKPVNVHEHASMDGIYLR